MKLYKLQGRHSLWSSLHLETSSQLAEIQSNEIVFFVFKHISTIPTIKNALFVITSQGLCGWIYELQTKICLRWRISFCKL